MRLAPLKPDQREGSHKNGFVSRVKTLSRYAEGTPLGQAGLHTTKCRTFASFSSGVHLSSIGNSLPRPDGDRSR